MKKAILLRLAAAAAVFGLCSARVCGRDEEACGRGRALHQPGLQFLPAGRRDASANWRRRATWSRSPITSTTGTISAGRTRWATPENTERQIRLRQILRRALGLHAAGRHQRPHPCQRLATAPPSSATLGEFAEIRRGPQRRHQASCGPAIASIIDAGERAGRSKSAHLVLVYFDPAQAGRHRARREQAARRSPTGTRSPASRPPACGMARPRASNFRAARSPRSGGCAVLLQSMGKDGLPGPDPRRGGRSAGSRDACATKDRVPDRQTTTTKNRCQLGADTGLFGFGIVAPGSLRKTEVGSIRRRPVGGGLGVYEPVPDRTVSGNEGMIRRTLGRAARIKNGSNVAKHHQS